MKRKIEINQYEYNGINIIMEINYCNHTMSVVDYKNGDFTGKNFMFAGRDKSFYKGWIDILDAIKFAITEANKLLEIDEDNHQKQVLEVMQKIQEMEENNNLNK